jgi:hypothetical protein
LSTELHPSFDAEEQAILAEIKADDGEMQPEDEQPPEAATPETAAPAQVATPEPAKEAPAATPAAEAKPAEQPQGDVKAALRASRRAEARTRQELDKLKEEVEQLRKGMPVAQDSQAITPDELETIKQDFPLQHKLYLQQQELSRQLAETRQVAQPATTEEFMPIEFKPQVQELVDQVPDLLNWQHDPASQDKLTRAIAYDAALEKDPDWIGKPVLERFAEAVSRTKRAFGAAPTPVTTTRTDPAAVIAALPPTGPRSISDFGGGQPASAPSVDFSRMSDEEIMARLPNLP